MVLFSSLNPTRSDDQRNEESIGDQEVVIKSEDNHNNGSSDEEMCETSQDIHSTEGLFMCLLKGCQNTFELKQNYTRHQLVVHPDAFPHKPWIQCSHTGCQFRTKHTGTMTQHSHKHTKPFVCTRCGQTFTSNIALRLHSMRNNCHPISQTNERTVESQDVNTNEESNADQEVVLKSGGHRDNGSNDTIMCDKPKVIQTTDGLFACSLNGCQNTFEFKQNLTRHHLVVHPDAFPDIPWIECQYTGCEYRTKHKHTMRQHEYKHTKPFKCSRCGQGFKSNRALEVHSKKQHNKQLVRVRTRGSGCGNTSVNKSRLKSQTNRQTVGTQVMNTNADQEVVIKSEDIQLIEELFVCSLNGCEFSCRRKPDINRHQLVVHPDAFPHKPWLKCPQKGCQYRTKHKGTLTQHSYRHTTPFKCTQCGQTFPTNFALKHHFQRNHNKELVIARTQRSTCGKSTVNKSRLKSQPNRQTVGTQDVNTNEESFGDQEVVIKSEDIQSIEELFVCSLNGCEFSNRRKPDFNRHQLVVHPDAFPHKPWLKCPQKGCQYRTKHKGTLTQHSYRHTTPFKCTQCGQTFPTNFALKHHFQRNHNKELVIARTQRSTCGKSTVNKSRLKSQPNRQTVGTQDVNTNEESFGDQEVVIKSEDIQSIEELFVCSLNGCEFSNRRKPDFNRHQLVVHPDAFPHKPWLKCPQKGCQYRTKHKGTLTHDESLTSIDTNWSYIRTPFPTNHGLNARKRVVIIHKKINGRFVCDYIGCGKSFTKLSKLNRHKYTHSAKSFRCDVDGCTAKYSSPIYLRDHKKRKHSTKYRCDWEGCDFKTGDKYTFNKHQLIAHSGERPFTCPVEECLKTFKDKYTMNDHKLIQHPDSVPEVPWIQCTHTDCQFRTKSKWSLKAHVRQHSKHYRCDECGKWFTHLSQLKGHVPTHSDVLNYRCDWPGFLFCFVY
ncbi:unnamed protein product [Oppiella nova]|uniref:C2H2-type domain-containing protein n=1 Tax=Oppiella nova TaxID=334625 RepID=A0A7R9QUP4_9ACAR|nr:unnamed protein product [Oppiella nova]CAG2174691.1 unnamed protein product [Oppiella nova]